MYQLGSPVTDWGKGENAPPGMIRRGRAYHPWERPFLHIETAEGGHDILAMREESVMNTGVDVSKGIGRV